MHTIYYTRRQRKMRKRKKIKIEADNNTIRKKEKKNKLNACKKTPCNAKVKFNTGKNYKSNIKNMQLCKKHRLKKCSFSSYNKTHKTKTTVTYD